MNGTIFFQTSFRRLCSDEECDCNALLKVKLPWCAESYVAIKTPTPTHP